MTPGLRLRRLPIDDRRVRAALGELLRANQLCSVATVATGARAHIHTAYFATGPNGTLYFCSYPESDHSRNMRRNPSAAVTVFDSRQRWGRPDRGLQLFGAVGELGPEAEEEARTIYRARYPKFDAWHRGLTDRGRAFPLRFYRFTPVRAKIFDERRFGGGTWVEVRFGRPSRPGEGRRARARSRP